jgi:hypothetical protein
MKFTKEPPYGLGELACIINATIDVLELKINKLSTASLGQTNNALIGIGSGYQSSFSLANQWLQLVDMFERMKIDDKTRDDILKMADAKFEYLKTNKKVI